MKKSKLVFKKGINRIAFPCFKPIGVIDFDRYARQQIKRIADNYLPRKRVTWDYKWSLNSDVAEVIATKI